MILGMEPKNQVILTTRCKVIAKHISIYLDIFYEKLVGSGWPQARSKTKNIFVEDLHWATCGLWMLLDVTPEPPQKKVSFKKCDFSGT